MADAADDPELERPDVPITLMDLTTRPIDPADILEKRYTSVATLRRLSILLTYATDWSLYHDVVSGRTGCYLRDVGCQRIRGTNGVEIENIGDMERIELGDPPGAFMYIVRGDGFNKVTGERLPRVEGGRASTEEIFKGKTGADLELDVRQAAFANLCGRITRALTGLGDVPVSELEAVWKGTRNNVADCIKARGFGGVDERTTGVSDKAPNVAPPICPFCNVPGVYRPARGDRQPFYGCQNWKAHPKGSKAWIVDAAKWIAQQAPPPVEPLPVSEVFREPGQEG